MNRITVFLCDDHTMVREGIRSVLEETDGIEVVGEASTGVGLEERLRETDPSVLLLDITLPERSGLEVARALKQLPAPPRILFLTMHDHPQYVSESVAVGADGYVLKSCSPEDLEEAIRRVARGERAFEQVANQLTSVVADRTGAAATLDSLTRREREVLVQVASGKTSKQIAAELGISARTVERHRDSLSRKLDLRSVADLTRFAMRTGLID